VQDNPNYKEDLISKAATMLHFLISIMPEKTAEERGTALMLIIAVFEDLSFEEASLFISENKDAIYGKTQGDLEARFRDLMGTYRDLLPGTNGE
jgi:hypothetical protein